LKKLKKIVSITLLFILVLQTVSIAYAWEVERPAGTIDIIDRTENAYTNGEASVGLGVSIDKYIEHFSDYEGADFLNLNVSMTANSRMGIKYTYDWESLWWIPESELYYRNDMVGVGDDVIIPIDIPQPPDVYYFAFRFFGGVGSGEYQRLYVSSNGFISFDNRSGSSPKSGEIPSTAQPNALIAAVWSDLNVDSSSSIITGFWVMMGKWYHVIIWENVLHKLSGKRLTFEIILENAPQYRPANRRYGQSQIWISYKDVSSINTYFSFGIEDQQGAKGLGGRYWGSSLSDFNGHTIYFYQSSNSYFLNRLTLIFQDTNPNTEIEIREEDPRYLRGWNVQWDVNQPPKPDPTYMFAKALAGTATLLIGAWSLVGNVPMWVAAAGFMIDTVLYGLDRAEEVRDLAYKQYSGTKVVVFDRNDGLLQNANCSALTEDYVVDASLCIVVHWILYTTNTEYHSLTITAAAEYYEYSTLTGEITPKSLSTSVVLEIGPDNNNNFSSAWQISSGWYYKLYIGGYDKNDYYKVNVNKGYIIFVYYEDAFDTGADVRLYLYNPSRVEEICITITSRPYRAYFSITAHSSGTWFIRVESIHGEAFYNLHVYVWLPKGGVSGGGNCNRFGRFAII
jgi:hypothetical protein